MRLIPKAVIVLCLLEVILTPSLHASSFTIALHGVEKSSGHQFTISFGHDPQATRCQDTALGEQTYPPPGPSFSLLWTRFNVPPTCYPQWMALDLRPTNSLRDTFQFYMSAYNLSNAITDTVTLSWSDLSSFGGPVELRYTDDSGLHSVDMKSTNSLVLETSQYVLDGFHPNMKIYARLYSDDIPPVPLLDRFGMASAVIALLILGAYALRKRNTTV